MVITDRDIVIRCITDGNDPGTTTAGSLCDGPPVTIGADDPGQDVLATMAVSGAAAAGARRGPPGRDRFESDIAHHASDRDIADTVQAVTEK